MLGGAVRGRGRGRRREAGARTALVEGYGFLGGMGTAASVTNFCGLYTKRGESCERIVGGIATPILERLRRCRRADVLTSCSVGRSPRPTTTWPTATSSTTSASRPASTPPPHPRRRGAARGARLTALFVENRTGRFALTAGVFVDASGDASLCRWAGVPTDTAAELAWPTTMFRLGDVDDARALGEGKPQLPELTARAREEGWALPRRPGYVNPQPHAGEWRVNATHLGERGRAFDCSDAVQLTRAELLGRRQMRDYHRFLRGASPARAVVPARRRRAGGRAGDAPGRRPVRPRRRECDRATFEDSIGVSPGPWKSTARTASTGPDRGARLPRRPPARARTGLDNLLSVEPERVLLAPRAGRAPRERALFRDGRGRRHVGRPRVSEGPLPRTDDVPYADLRAALEASGYASGMSSPLVQLAADVVVEPLVSSYPAWWCNVSPLPSALHLTGYQLPRFGPSSVRRAHTGRPRAIRRLPAAPSSTWRTHAPWVASLADGLESGRAAELELARDYWAFTATLFERGKGQTLEPLYGELPASLRGLVELAYDYHARPFLRFDEGLAYAAAPREHESLRIFRLARDADRPFYMSTPTPPGPGEVAWRTAFDAEATRVLLELDTTPRTLDELRSARGRGGLDALETLVCPAARPRRARPWPRATCGSTTSATPASCSRRRPSTCSDPSCPAAGGRAPPRFRALPERIDFAVVTHAHRPPRPRDALRLRGRIGTLVVPKNHGVASGDVSLRLLARRLGFSASSTSSRSRPSPPGGGRLSATPFHGEHGDILHGNKASYVLELEGRSVPSPPTRRASTRPCSSACIVRSAHSTPSS